MYAGMTTKFPDVRSSGSLFLFLYNCSKLVMGATPLVFGDSDLVFALRLS